jgi:hypothetical protein
MDADGAASFASQDTVGKETTMRFLEAHVSDHEARNKASA